MLSKVFVALLAASSAALAAAEKGGSYNYEKQVPEGYRDDAYATKDGPVVVMENFDYYPEVMEDYVNVPYQLKGPKYEGHIEFLSESATYETNSDGPYLPEMKPKAIYSPIFEKQFVCPKYEKMIVVKVPAKCACQPIEIKPNIVKAPEFKEHTKDVYSQEGPYGETNAYCGKDMY
ncbi:hypothetical protein SeMB42_g07453 [Synchytrium endobioticum]|uniref:Uncharacterized protein n=1 Tax=Synchytrium endobioticum TaxID=286115 RepID=A0A507C7Q1_9FUNG|nr:hypothetical protein SeMB42_g07453 [Synchytrium endobioticum]